ncbi:MAG: VOC family protein [Anaerolineae bacterium]
MKLGDRVELSLSVKDLDTTLDFFSTLGYQQLAESYDEPAPWVVLSDGHVNVALHQKEAPSPSLVYFTADLDRRLALMEEHGIALVKRTENQGRTIMASFEDPNGQGLAVADMVAAHVPAPEGRGRSRLGHFGELSIPTTGLKKSVAFYRALGYERIGGDEQEPYPWAVMFDGMIPIGLHETDDFGATTITYFATDMVARIAAVEAEGIPLAWSKQNKAGEIAAARIETPDGQPLFLFEGEGEAFG